jgi:(2R)-3-sulfolactate dehydrogenase (NADP+)
MTDSVTLTIADIEELAARALVHAGASESNAAPLARAVAQAHRDGIPSHGLAYVPTYCEHVQCGKVVGDATPTLENPKPATLVADAANGFAHPAIDMGFAELIPLARAQGIACLAVRNSYNCGVLGYHTGRLAEAGLLGLGFTNSPASIAPAGGKTPVVGTNPYSVAAPDGQGNAAILIDQSASVVAKSEIIQHARRDEDIPEGWALDPDGNPTTDSDIALKGSMMPSGGYKGVGAAVLVELLAAAASGATLGVDASPFSGTAGGPPATGQFFIAIDADTTSGGAYGKRLGGLIAAIEGQPGARLHGQRRREAQKAADAGGVSVDQATLDRVNAVFN